MKVNFYAIIFDPLRKGSIYVLYRYNIVTEDSLWKCFRLESLDVKLYIAHVCLKQLEVCVNPL